MGESFSSLTLYRLRQKKVTDFREFLDPQKKVSAYSLKSKYQFQAQLFVAPPDTGPPSWREPLEAAFGGLGEIPDSVSNCAVLIVGIKTKSSELHFAATFGFGRFLLRAGIFERNYGMRVALNAIYPKRKEAQLDPDRL